MVLLQDLDSHRVRDLGVFRDLNPAVVHRREKGTYIPGELSRIDPRLFAIL